MRNFLLAVAFFASLFGILHQAHADDERGSLGFSLEVEGDGFFLNPTVKSVTITAVSAGSPARLAGIAVKDQVVEADGHAVVGAKARDLEPLLKKRVGQALTLKLKRPNGEEYVAVLIAVQRSSKP